MQPLHLLLKQRLQHSIHLPLSAVLPGPFALLSLALLVLFCLDCSFTVTGLGCGRSISLVAISVWGKFLLWQYLLFSPLSKLLSFQGLVRTEQASEGVYAYIAYWAQIAVVVSRFHVFSVETWDLKPYIRSPKFMPYQLHIALRST